MLFAEALSRAMWTINVAAAWNYKERGRRRDEWEGPALIVTAHRLQQSKKYGARYAIFWF